MKVHRSHSAHLTIGWGRTVSTDKQLKEYGNECCKTRNGVNLHKGRISAEVLGSPPKAGIITDPYCP